MHSPHWMRTPRSRPGTPPPPPPPRPARGAALPVGAAVPGRRGSSPRTPPAPAAAPPGCRSPRPTRPPRAPPAPPGSLQRGGVAQCDAERVSKKQGVGQPTLSHPSCCSISGVSAARTASVEPRNGVHQTHRNPPSRAATVDTKQGLNALSGVRLACVVQLRQRPPPTISGGTVKTC